MQEGGMDRYGLLMRGNVMRSQELSNARKWIGLLRPERLAVTDNKFRRKSAKKVGDSPRKHE
jgi:hypothetical protein